MRTSESTDLATRQTVVEKVRVWEECAEAIRQACLALHGAEQRLTRAFSGPGRYLSLQEELRYAALENPERMIECLQVKAWAGIFDALEVRQFLSVAETAKLDAQLGRNPRRQETTDLPPITVENVMATLRSLHASIPKFAEESVREVFEMLRPRNSRHKTNSEWKVGRKVVLERIFTSHTGSGQWYPHFNHYYDTNKLRALDRAFHLLDGKGYVSKSYLGDLGNALQAVTCATLKGCTEYFEFQVFRNGNVHLTFRRPDLVEQLNRVAGGQPWLKRAS